MRLVNAYNLIREKLSDTNILERCNVEKPLKVYNEKCIIASDWHIPFVNENLFDQLITNAQYMNIRDIIINGDFWDCYAISRFQRRLRIDFQDEKKAINAYLDVLCEEFERVFFCLGNHEERWMRLLGYADDINGLFDSVGNEHKNFSCTNNDYIILNDKWYVCHPQQYATQELTLARKLASVYNMNIIAGHQHHMARGHDVSGKYTIIDSGGLFDINKLDYVQKTTTHPKQISGFIIIKDDNVIGVYE